MTRTEAGRLIDAIRRILAEHENATGRDALHSTPVQDILREFDKAGVSLPEKCTGEAHSNAYIDNCMLCAPHWGWLVDKTVVR